FDGVDHGGVTRLALDRPAREIEPVDALRDLEVARVAAMLAETLTQRLVLGLAEVFGAEIGLGATEPDLVNAVLVGCQLRLGQAMGPLHQRVATIVEAEEKPVG